MSRYHVTKDRFDGLPERIIVREDGYLDAYKNEGIPIVDYAYTLERTCHITPYGLPLSDCPIGKCSNCGHGADANSRYCWQCGAKVER